MRKFIFGSYIYDYWLVRQERETLSLTVTSDLRIIVKAPLKADLQRVEIFLRKKWFWLEKQLSFFKKFQRKIYTKEYLSGESFWYLGRQYKLVVKKAKVDRVVLSNGKLTVFSSKLVGNGQYNKSLLNNWYNSKRAEEAI
jgi:predicted metal-dependent hydrolase